MEDHIETGPGLGLGPGLGSQDSGLRTQDPGDKNVWVRLDLDLDLELDLALDLELDLALALDSGLRTQDSRLRTLGP